MQFSKKIQKKEINSITLFGPIKSDKNSIFANYDKTDNSSIVIFIDGGINFIDNIESLNLDNTYFVGDLDSAEEKKKKLLDSFMEDNIFQFSSDKDQSDLELALRLLTELTPNFRGNTINIFNILGARQDHHFSNLLALQSYVANHPLTNLILKLDSNVIISKGKVQIDHQGIFSIFTLNENSVTISGQAKYRLKQEALRPQSSQGLSNMAQGKVEIESSNSVIIFLE
ncbi:MAG: thiamine diphosphokinase [Oligoflexia bacterium]|nr:thiamine diphosphokinase [Oligoflexia bacterium]